MWTPKRPTLQQHWQLPKHEDRPPEEWMQRAATKAVVLHEVLLPALSTARKSQLLISQYPRSLWSVYSGRSMVLRHCGRWPSSQLLRSPSFYQSPPTWGAAMKDADTDTRVDKRGAATERRGDHVWGHDLYADGTRRTVFSGGLLETSQQNASPTPKLIRSAQGLLMVLQADVPSVPIGCRTHSGNTPRNSWMFARSWWGCGCSSRPTLEDS